MAKKQPVRKREVRQPKRSPVGASPGTLIADPQARRSELSLTLIGPEGCEFIANATLSQVREARSQWRTIWLDCVGLANVDLIAEIGAIFGLHPLALEDTVNTSQRPKVDFFENHAFVVMKMIDDLLTTRYEQISLHFGEDFVVTFQEREGDPFNPVRKRIAKSLPNRIRERKADYLAYALIDAIVDSYFPPVEATSEKIDNIEDEVLQATEKNQVRLLHEMRRGTGTLKRALWPMRDAVAGLIRSDATFIDADTKVFLNDTLDHTERLLELVESHREMLIGLIDMHLSLSQARTNDIISFLTIVSAIFIPLTFLAGIWGMNFDPAVSGWNMPELEWAYGYPAALGFMAFVGICLAGYFKWRRWL